MPTTKPRLAITISPRARSVLGRIAKHTHEPASRIVSGLLEDAAPMLEQVASTMDALAEQSKGYRSDVVRKMTKTERAMLKALAASMDILAEVEREARRPAAGDGRAAPAQAAGRRTPGLVTRG